MSINIYKRIIIPFCVLIFISVMVGYRLNNIPSPWWDEGWTLNVARNWVEAEHYGQYIAGVPRTSGLSAAFPVVAPVALSFRLFGIGVLQGRLPSVICLLGSLSLIYFHAVRLYNRSTAIGVLLILFFLAGPLQLHPLTLGRTVMAEMPMIFYLLAGYTFLLLALRKSGWFILLAALGWGIAIITKDQALPFWIASLLFPIGVLVIKRCWQQAGLLMAGLILSLLVSIGLEYFLRLLIPELRIAEPIPNLFEAVAIVLDPGVRKTAFMVVLTLGFPTFIGFAFAAWKSFQSFREQNYLDEIEILKLTLLGFVGSWLAWYILLALYLERYLFPVVFVGSIFTSAFLYELTFQFDFKRTIKNASEIFFRSRNRYNIAFIVLVPIFILLSIINLRYLISFYRYPGPSINEVTEHLENITDENDVIETYESELFFLLDRRYHYPPDEIDVEMINKVFIGKDVSYSYDPFEANPDLLVIGEFGKLSKIYDNALASGKFRHIETFQGYEIFSRIEP